MKAEPLEAHQSETRVVWLKQWSHSQATVGVIVPTVHVHSPFYTLPVVRQNEYVRKRNYYGHGTSIAVFSDCAALRKFFLQPLAVMQHCYNAGKFLKHIFKKSFPTYLRPLASSKYTALELLRYSARVRGNFSIFMFKTF